MRWASAAVRNRGATARGQERRRAFLWLTRDCAATRARHVRVTQRVELRLSQSRNAAVSTAPLRVMLSSPMDPALVAIYAALLGASVFSVATAFSVRLPDASSRWGVSARSAALGLAAVTVAALGISDAGVIVSDGIRCPLPLVLFFAVLPVATVANMMHAGLIDGSARSTWLQTAAFAAAGVVREGVGVVPRLMPSVPGIYLLYLVDLLALAVVLVRVVRQATPSAPAMGEWLASRPQAVAVRAWPPLMMATCMALKMAYVARLVSAPVVEGALVCSVMLSLFTDATSSMLAAAVRVESARWEKAVHEADSRALAIEEAADSAHVLVFEYVANSLLNPIQAVIGSALLLLDDLPASGGGVTGPQLHVLRTGLDGIVQQGRSCGRLIWDAKDVALLRRGRLPLVVGAVDVRRTITTAAAATAHTYASTINVHVDDDVPQVVVSDGLRLRQVLSIAIAHTLRGGAAAAHGRRELRVSCEGPQHIRFVVQSRPRPSSGEEGVAAARMPQAESSYITSPTPMPLPQVSSLAATPSSRYIPAPPRRRSTDRELAAPSGIAARARFALSLPGATESVTASTDGQETIGVVGPPAIRVPMGSFFGRATSRSRRLSRASSDTPPPAPPGERAASQRRVLPVPKSPAAAPATSRALSRADSADSATTPLGILGDDASLSQFARAIDLGWSLGQLLAARLGGELLFAPPSEEGAAAAVDAPIVLVLPLHLNTESDGSAVWDSRVLDRGAASAVDALQHPTASAVVRDGESVSAVVAVTAHTDAAHDGTRRGSKATAVAPAGVEGGRDSNRGLHAFGVAHAGAAAMPSEPEVVPQLGLHVLYADDESVNRRLMASILRKLGCTCEALEDGDLVAAALQRARSQPVGVTSAAGTAVTVVVAGGRPADSVPTADAAEATTRGARPFDAVLLDIVMARSDGADVCAALRSSGVKLPICAVTGNARDSTYLLDRGFDVVVPKPFSLHAIASALIQSAAIRSRPDPRRRPHGGAAQRVA